MKRLLSVCVVLSIAAGMFLCAEKVEIGESLLERNAIRTVFKTDSPMPAAQRETTDTVTIDTGDSYGLREEEKRILLAYAKYLQKYYKDYPYETDRIKYDLVFIDIDNIPELAVIPSDAHVSGVQICVYADGKVVEAGEFGSFGKCSFNPYENLIFSTHMGQGEEESFFFRLEGNESMELLALHSVPQYENFQYTGTYYEIDGTEVSEEVYKQVCEEWDWEELNVWGYEDAVSVNDIDNLYRELYDRYSFLKEQGRVEQDDSCLEEWKQAYLTYIDEDEYADTCTYSLIYVDDDDVPELVIDTGFEAGGCQILTFHDHFLDVWQSGRLNVSYIERGNLICNSDGNMGYYYDNVYAIQDGKWVYADGGIWGDGPDGVQLDENENIIEFFYWTGEEPWNREEYWSGEEMTEEEYEARLNAVYPMEQSMYPQKYYILDEIKSILRAGDVTSAGHRYELIVEDVSWKEAERLCHERGGYLATITSQEEFGRLQSQMLAEDKADITFFVGAKKERTEGMPFGYRWLEPGTEKGYYMLELSNALFDFWLEGEPSYSGLTESGREIEEAYVVLLYRKSDGRCYINDVPNDILEAAPSYAGRVGYICEYE